MNYLHICNKIKCSCGCEYCPSCYNGCPQCGRGELEVITTTTTYLSIAKKAADSMNVEKKEEQFGVGDESMYNFGWNECLSKIEKQKEDYFGKNL